VLGICISAFTPIHEGFKAALGPEIFDLCFPGWKEQYAKDLATISPTDTSTRVYVAERDGAVGGLGVELLRGADHQLDPLVTEAGEYRQALLQRSPPGEDAVPFSFRRGDRVGEEHGWSVVGCQLLVVGWRAGWPFALDSNDK
jgi:hypothetical protein